MPRALFDHLKPLLALCLLAGLCACASPSGPSRQALADLLQDSAFRPASVPSANEIFAADAHMQRFLSEQVRPGIRHLGASRALIEGLRRGSGVRIDYDASETRSAADTLRQGAGNCLSLVLMTAALAKQLNLPVSYQEVSLSNAWSRNRDTYIRLGHVNITIGYRDLHGTARYVSDPAWTIDFLPAANRQQRVSTEISEARVLAMFLNNRAAELMQAGELDAAYWHARSAVLTDPAFLGALNTLGIIYHRHGQQAVAEQVFRSLVAQPGDQALALSNLVLVLDAQGKTEQARAAEAQLARLDTEKPFRDLLLGLAALEQGQYALALRHFERELRRDPDYHETHFGLAVAHYQLGNLAAAERHLRQAQGSAETSQDRIRYAAKLGRLHEQQAGG